MKGHRLSITTIIIILTLINVCEGEQLDKEKPNTYPLGAIFLLFNENSIDVFVDDSDELPEETVAFLDGLPN